MSFSSPSAAVGSPSPRPHESEGLQAAYNYAWAGLALFLGLVIFTSTRAKNPYDDIPAIGSTGFFSSYLSAIKYIKNAKIMLQEGYNKHKNGVFRIPEMTRWHVIVSGERLVEELRRAPDDVLSFDIANNELLNTYYTLGPNLVTNWYQIPVIKGQLTHNLGRLLPVVQNEIALAFEEYVPVTDSWTKIKAYDTVMKVVSRASNRIFVGTPTCRDPEYIALNIQFTLDVFVGARIIGLLPSFLRPLAGNLAKHLFTNVPRTIRTAMKHLKPIIDERQRNIDEYGFDYPDKPNDMLSWLMDEAKGEERSAKNLTLRLLFINLGAIHTSSLTFTHALYHLASRPEYVNPIREEIEAVVSEEGWSKASMTHMRKLDSFLKESQRVSGLGFTSLTRKAVKDYTFADGTHVPNGAYISAIATARQSDDEVYEHGATFDGFRFSNLRDEEGQGTKNQMVATNPEYLPFGHGRHACPGRFFAASELKEMLAHVVLTYDIKLENEGVRPEDEYFGVACLPNSKAEVLFRKRQN